jgi:F0F1-type ATP synthase assembly protein I
LTKKNNGRSYRYVQVAVTFGISTILRIYILGVLAGGWLDRKLGVFPWFTLIGVLMGIFLSFKFLLEQLSICEKSNNKGAK